MKNILVSFPMSFAYQCINTYHFQIVSFFRHTHALSDDDVDDDDDENNNDDDDDDDW